MCSSVKGLVVSLDELGHLDCSFLGTVPPSFTAVQGTGARDLNYEVCGRVGLCCVCVMSHDVT